MLVAVGVLMVLAIARELHLDSALQLAAVAVLATAAVNLTNRRYTTAAMVIGGGLAPIVVAGIGFWLESCDSEECGMAVGMGTLMVAGVVFVFVTLPTLIAGVRTAARDIRSRSMQPPGDDSATENRSEPRPR